ncbi:MAG: CoA ester lyase [Candidatus Binatia bacterium]
MPADAAIVRSLLFAPAARPERFDKAVAAGADAVIVDLEDAVAPQDKDDARRQALPWFRRDAAGDVLRCLRVNSPRTAHGLRDLLALVDTGTLPDLLMIPKVESAEELDVIDQVLAGPARAIGFLALVESARGLAAAERIAAHPRTRALVLGGADLAADLGAAFAWEPLLWARGRLVQAAATAGISAIDVPWLALDDDAGLEAEAVAVRRLGCTGKLAVHPRHVATINAVFTPAEDDVARAQRIVSADDAAHGGVCLVDGRMVDAAVVRAARRTLARAARWCR